MSSFVIGLDISRNHVTATLVRIEQVIDRKLTIERDTFYIRSFRENIKKDPCLIVSGWIDCIDDLLHDFIDYYQEDDKIIGIACGISKPMDYEQGICHIQSSKSNENDRFFGLNLRLLFQSGLRDLIRRGKYHHHPKYYTPPTSPRTSLFSLKPQMNPKTSEQTTRVIRTSSTPHTTFHFPIIPTITEEIQSSKLSIRKLSYFCGLHDGENDEIISPDQTFTHTNEISSPKLSVTTDNFSLKLRSMIDQLSDIPISFFNDTICFAVGEANNIYNKDYERILVLTLGTSFASAFIDRGEIIKNRHDIPSNGMISTENDGFSTRGLIRIYRKLLQHKTDISNGYSLALRAFDGDKNAIKAYQIFAHRLGKFLVPYIKSFHPNLLLIGGGIAQAWYLIENELYRTLEKSCPIEIYFSLSNEKFICLGAVQQQLSILFTPKSKILRQTDQYLLPVVKIRTKNPYDFYPNHEIPIGYIGIGHKQLNEKMFRLIRENNILLIDGFIGTYFDEFSDKLNQYYSQQRQKFHLPSLTFYDTSIFLRTKKSVKQESNSSSIFDKLRKDLIDLNQLNYLQTNLSYPCVIIGPGASFINETSPLIYIDLPKNEFYYRISTKISFPYLTLIKIFNKLKQELLLRTNFFVDGQRPNCPTWLDGDTFRQALAYISNQPIRIRPWFKTVYQTNESSSEIMTSNNGIILSDANHHLAEFSWNILYSSQANRILGNDRHYRLFNGSNDFPICFYLLDMTNDEDIHKNFKAQLRRDKSHYIIETKSPCKNGKGLTIENSSQCIHDLFFIPNEINHPIGRNQIILEISTRSDIDDRFPSLSNKHGELFRCQPISFKYEQDKYEEQQLSTPDFYIYDIQRLIIEGNESIEIIRYTENRFHLCILVEGDTIEIEYNSIDNNQDKQIRQYNSIETFLIPASIHQYCLRPRIKTQDQTTKSHRFILLIIFLK